MTRKILVPLDGSPVGEAALGYSESLARSVGGSMTLLHVSPGGRASTDQMVKADSYLKEIASRLQGHGAQVEVAIAYGGSVSNWIAEEAEIRQADLVVMGTHARAGLDRMLHGSIAQDVLRRLRAPVLVVRAELASQAERFERPAPCLVVSLDGSRFAESALVPARDLAHALGARLVLVEVVPDGTPHVIDSTTGTVAYVDEGTQARTIAEAEAYLLEIQRGLRARDFEAHLDVRVGDPGEQIRLAAASHSAAAVVMATHGRTGLKRALVGSVAGNVLQHGAAPVVLVPPGALASDETRV
jgi:nucleotide-binding universal stress UspA family protein